MSKLISKVVDQKIKNALNQQKLMVLSTSDGKGNLWSAPLYFLYDSKFNVYFMSNPKSLHCRNIEKSKKVSLTICDSSQQLSDDKYGIQIAGMCKKLTTLSQINLVLKMWKRLGAGSENLKLADLKAKRGSRFYKITPTIIKIFDSTRKEKEMTSSTG